MMKKPGFIAALDQSGGSTPGALKRYGGEELLSQCPTIESQMDAIHDFRIRVMTSDHFNSQKVVAAILFTDTLKRTVDGLPTAQYLWQQKGIVPFLKIDQGLEADNGGYQLMKPIDNLQELLELSIEHGVFGTKARSVINHGTSVGIELILAQQFELAQAIIQAGLTPIIEPEVSVACLNKAETEMYLAMALKKHLDKLAPGQDVILKLTIPEDPQAYEQLTRHPNVMRVVALSGGHSQKVATSLLQNCRNISASFSRALLEGLTANMKPPYFNATLGASIDEIYRASTNQSPAVAA